MPSIVCTLFENTYHFGVAGLINSLYKHGYRGEVYAGYKGKLPDWAITSEQLKASNWPGSNSLKVFEDLVVHFLPLSTDYHLTNYKPDFMLDLLEKDKIAEGVFYFDPDIVINGSWAYFDNWIKYGVALSEDVNSPLPENHPRRSAWRQYFGDRNVTLTYKDSIYVNGGFAGVSRADKGFLETWRHVQEVMAPEIGGLSLSMFTKAKLPEHAKGPLAPFSRTDQDALNAAIEAWNGKVSLIGKEGMAFAPGFPIMPHALGNPKPWNGKFLLNAFKGKSPRICDREYWQLAKGPVKLYSPFKVKVKQTSIVIANAIGRFYSRS